MGEDEDGEQQFSVQSFLVSPEELTLLKPTHTWTTAPCSNGELTIDAKMLRQLSEAGMTIGKQFEMSAVDLILQSTKNAQTVQKFAENLHCNNPEQLSVLEQLFENIKSMVNMIQQKSENGIITAAAALLNREMQNINVHINGNNEQHSMNNTNGDIENDLINILSTTVMDCVIECAKNMVNEQPNNQHVLKVTKYRQQNNNSSCSNNNSTSMYEIISQVLAGKFQQFFTEEEINIDADSCNTNIMYLNAIEKMLASSKTLEKIKSEVNTLVQKTIEISKVNLIKATINKEIYNDTEIMENICIILQNENETEMIDAIRDFFECEPKILYSIKEKLREEADKLVDDTTTSEILKKCIVSAVQQSTHTDIKQIIASLSSTANECGSSSSSNEKKKELNVYLLDTISMAKALGLTECAQNILNVLNCDDEDDKADVQCLANDNQINELLQRVIIMHKLSKHNAERQESLALLRRDPYAARNDTTLRELLRQSGICTIDPIKRSEITDSNDVPISLFLLNNQLVIEDFLMRKQAKTRGAFLICKNGFQAVVPRESSRDVLIGKCAYTMLDENGIRHFEPLHVFSALKLKNASMYATRFSMYSCDYVDNNDIDFDVESILTMSSAISPATISVLSNHNEYDLVKEVYLPNNRYKTTILPKKDFTDFNFLKNQRARQELFGKQVNYRRSFYL